MYYKINTYHDWIYYYKSTKNRHGININGIGLIKDMQLNILLELINDVNNRNTTDRDVNI